MKWADAVRIFGDDVLTAEAKTPQSKTNWKARGVPSHVLARLLGTVTTLPERRHLELPRDLDDLLAEFRHEAAFEEGLPSRVIQQYSDRVKEVEQLFLANVRHFNAVLQEHRARLRAETGRG